MKNDDLIKILLDKLRWLRLSGMAQNLEAILAQANKENLTPIDVLLRLCDEEKQARVGRAVERRIKGAHFPEVNTIDGFDFGFDTCRKKLRARYLAMHDSAFLAKGINPIFIGGPGTGKTFLARSLAYRVCQAQKRVVVTSAARMLNQLSGAEIHGGLERALTSYVRAELLVIDDFAVLGMDPAQAKLAFHVVSERYDYRRSTCITTNRAFKDWPKVFPDPLNAEVIAKRLTERSECFVLDGKAYMSPGA
jgi:DNA replication protein DnaC